MSSIRSLIFGAGVLTAVALGVWTGFAIVHAKSPERLLAATVAGGISWGAAILGVVIFVCGGGGEGNLAAAGIAILTRLGLSMGALALLVMGGGPLARAGVGGMLVVFYLALLAAETVLFAWWATPRQNPVDSTLGKPSQD